ncbi:MAG: beta-ketoacyl synthase N-terminal-like domain-containing protein [Nostocales cyanobacterium 94392]|nr:beta-ketoacyl synthase N-terminal-like domain-containing protein [Nostocales cyanobacterium 94392]
MKDSIAIIGLGCRFPKSETPEAFWHLLSNGIDAITEIPADRWSIDELYAPQPATPGKMNTRWGGFISQVYDFDSLFFNISPKEAERIHPQQRLFLEVAWEALENASLATDKLSGTRTAVFAGMELVKHDQLLYRNTDDLAQINAYDAIGTTPSLGPSRLSYLLNLKGPSLVVETACSSSLVAIHLAIQSLRTGESNLCIVGGVNLILTPELSIMLSQSQMMSPEGRCKTFDASANGYVRGEGCGVVILKNLSDALEDNDNILAVIRGSAVNQDGISNGITAPNGLSQEAVIRQACKNAGVKPAEISYIEAHGTGTPLGDPIEVNSLKKVLMEERQSNQRCFIGSVKTNFGHLELAAGIAGLIKAVLALQHKKIPPHLHLKQLNPYIRLGKTPLSIPTEIQEWNVEGKTRLAGVSSFGFGGTNAHVILEEAPTVAKNTKAEFERPLHILALSARNDLALAALAQKYSNFLDSKDTISLADICFTANVGRTYFERRLVAIANSKTELQKSLQAFAAGVDTENIVRSGLSIEQSLSSQVAFLFTGQGSQYVGMGRELYETQPTFRKALNRCGEILSSYLDKPLLEIIYSFNSTSDIDQTQYTQPVLFAVEYSLAQLWQSWGIKPTLVMGHSVGEYVAACLAGVFSLEDGLKLIAERGRLMQSLPQNGAMVSLLAEPEQVIKAIDTCGGEVTIAAFNGLSSVVISGKQEAVENLVSKLEIQGVKSKALKVSHGFHSPLMEPMLEEFERVAREVTYSPPQIQLISNVTGELVTNEIATPEYWCEHIRLPVKFVQGMATLAQQDCKILLEIGSQPILLGMARLCLSSDDEDYAFLPSLRPQKADWQQMLESLAELYLRGIAVDWQDFENDYPQRRRQAFLPTYPFQRQRYCIKDNQKHQNVPLPAIDSTTLLYLLSQGKIERVKSILETTGELSASEIKLLPKLLEVIAKNLQQKATVLKGDDNAIDNLIIDTTDANAEVQQENEHRQLNELLTAQPEKRRQLLKQYIGKLLTKVLKIKVSQLDWQQRFSSMGIDSLMATELRRYIKQDLDIAIPVEFLAELSLEKFLTQLLFLIDKHNLIQNQDNSNEIVSLGTVTKTHTKHQVEENLWVIRPQPNPQARLRLLCFSYAGAGASVFNPWVKELPSDIELCAIQLPGRENRFKESPLTHLKPLIQTLLPLLKPYLDQNFALFGHSMGALLSFELIRELRRQNCPLPVHLFVSSRKAPQLLEIDAPIHRLPDSQFIEKIKHFNGTPDEILQNKKFMQQFVPTLRSDFSILETYFYRNEPPLDCPITAFGGDQDPIVDRAELTAWNKQTSSQFDLQMFAGDHFFLHSAREKLLQAILTQLG